MSQQIQPFNRHRRTFMQMHPSSSPASPLPRERQFLPTGIKDKTIKTQQHQQDIRDANMQAGHKEIESLSPRHPNHLHQILLLGRMRISTMATTNVPSAMTN